MRGIELRVFTLCLVRGSLHRVCRVAAFDVNTVIRMWRHEVRTQRPTKCESLPKRLMAKSV